MVSDYRSANRLRQDSHNSWAWYEYCKYLKPQSYSELMGAARNILGKYLCITVREAARRGYDEYLDRVKREAAQV
jgi:hypothetical protein